MFRHKQRQLLSTCKAMGSENLCESIKGFALSRKLNNLKLVEVCISKLHSDNFENILLITKYSIEMTMKDLKAYSNKLF